MFAEQGKLPAISYTSREREILLVLADRMEQDALIIRSLISDVMKTQAEKDGAYEMVKRMQEDK